MSDNATFCAVCGTKNSFSLTEKIERFVIKGEEFQVPLVLSVCSKCHHEFIEETSDSGLALARKEYRERHGMIKPEHLNAWRNDLGITQAQLAEIMGWGTATVNRYENGKLAETSHDKALQMAMGSCENLLTLVQNARTLDEGVRKNLIAKIGSLISSDIVEAAFLKGAIPAPSEKVSLKKISQMAAAFCEGLGEFETKLNKLFFYADFLFYRSRGISISGMAYVRLPHGPVPSNFRSLYALLEKQNVLTFEEEMVGEFPGTRIKAASSWNKNDFSDAEISVIISVKNKFRGYTATQISDVSHEELAWTDTATGAIIDYRFASFIKAM